MTHIVNDRCIKCKYTDCVVVCPVDCFYEGKNMLVIDPEQCIDCGVCIDECPEYAIVTDEAIIDIPQEEQDSISDPIIKALMRFRDINAKYSKLWPNITKKKDALPEAEEYAGMAGKEKFFDENT